MNSRRDFIKNSTLTKVTGPGALALALMAMRYVRGNEMVTNQRRWKPMGIVGSFYNLERRAKN
jgi:hypothetical protein